MFENLLSVRVLGIPVMVLIFFIIKSFYFNSNRAKDESNTFLDDLVHGYHDESDKVVTFCPNCDKKYKIPPDIRIKVECPSCSKVNYHNI